MSCSHYKLIQAKPGGPNYLTVTVFGVVQGVVVCLRRVSDNSAVIALVSRVDLSDQFVLVDQPCNAVDFPYFVHEDTVYWQVDHCSWHAFNVSTRTAEAVQFRPAEKVFLHEEDFDEATVSSSQLPRQRWLTTASGYSYDATAAEWPMRMVEMETEDLVIFFDPVTTLVRQIGHFGSSLCQEGVGQVILSQRWTVLLMAASVRLFPVGKMHQKPTKERNDDFGDYIDRRPLSSCAGNKLFQLVRSMSGFPDVRVIDLTDDLREIARFTQLGSYWSSFAVDPESFAIFGTRRDLLGKFECVPPLRSSKDEKTQ